MISNSLRRDDEGTGAGTSTSTSTSTSTLSTEQSKTTSILEIQNNDTKAWQAVGSISTANNNAGSISGGGMDSANTRQKEGQGRHGEDDGDNNNNDNGNIHGDVNGNSNVNSNVNSNHKKLLPLEIKNILSPNAKVKSDRRSKYMYRHSHDKIDTNLLILLHGAGDTHMPYHEFAKKMKLPQTATLCIHANAMESPSASVGASTSTSASASASGSKAGGFVTLPFDLGHTWFEEMDYTTGEPLRANDKRRLKSLESACDTFDNILLDAIINSNLNLWIPERIFLFGFSSGACLAMNICYNRMKRGKRPLGGAVCVAGGLRGITSKINRDDNVVNNEGTPILLMGGQKDTSYTSSILNQDASLYTRSRSISCKKGDDLVKTFVQPGKGHEMIKHQEEIKCMMGFFADKMVRRMIAMEGWSEVATVSR